MFNRFLAFIPILQFIDVNLCKPSSVCLSVIRLLVLAETYKISFHLFSKRRTLHIVRHTDLFAVRFPKIECLSDKYPLIKV